MKKTKYFALAILMTSTFLVSCDEEIEAFEPSAIIIELDDMPYGNGVQSKITPFDTAVFKDVPGGPQQVWDLTDIKTGTNYVSRKVSDFSDKAFPGANYSFEVTEQNTLSKQERTYSAIRERSEKGLYIRGRKYALSQNVPVFGGAGTLVLEAGDQVQSGEGIPLMLFPTLYGERYSFKSTVKANFNITYPPAGLENTPANTIDSTFTNIGVDGWGQLKLPGYAREFEVIKYTHVSVIKRNYLLGGAPAPTSLLDPLELEQGKLTLQVFVYFIAKELGTVAFYEILDDKITTAYFRNDLPE